MDWLREKWRSVVAWLGIALAVVLGAVLYALGRGPKPDPLAEAEGRSDVLRERAKAKEREAEIIGERRAEIKAEIKASEETSEQTSEQIRSESMSELAERWKR